MSLTYIACPYGHPDKEVVKQRMEYFYAADAYFSMRGEFIITPMNKITTVEKHQMPGNWAFWEKYSYELLSKCDKIIVLTLPGWDKAPGVKAEIDYAFHNNLEIVYFDPTTIHTVEKVETTNDRLSTL